MANIVLNRRPNAKNLPNRKVSVSEAEVNTIKDGDNIFIHITSIGGFTAQAQFDYKLFKKNLTPKTTKDGTKYFLLKY